MYRHTLERLEVLVPDHSEKASFAIKYVVIFMLVEILPSIYKKHTCEVQ